MSHYTEASDYSSLVSPRTALHDSCQFVGDKVGHVDSDGAPKIQRVRKISLYMASRSRDEDFETDILDGGGLRCLSEQSQRSESTSIE